MMRALLDDREHAGPAEDFPHLGKLCRQHPAKEATDANVGEIIAAPPDLTLARAIVTELGMIERLLHEPGEGDRAFPRNRIADELNEIGIAGGHRVVKKVKSVTSLQRKPRCSRLKVVTFVTL